MEKAEVLRDTLRKCPPETVEAAVEYHRTGDVAKIPTIVLGIIERFVEPEVRPIVRSGSDETRLFDDLGIDSLLMVEIIIMIEETLEISLDQDELRGLQTLGDVKAFLRQKVEADRQTASS